MPDPLGPTNPTDVPASMSMDMLRRISTVPAFPSSDSETLDRDIAWVDIVGGFRTGSPFPYGAIRVLCNLVLVLGTMGTSANADGITIAAMGDSLTAGYGLSVQDGFVPQMQTWLDAQDSGVNLINAGVSGDTIAGGLARVEWTLTPEVDAMIVALGGNDYLRGFDPALSKANLDEILRIAADRGVDVLLIGLTVGANYGPDYQADFNEMFLDLATAYDVPLVPTFFQGLLDRAGSQDRVLGYMQADGIHPNRDGVAAIVSALGPEIIAFSKAIKRGE